MSSSNFLLNCFYKEAIFRIQLGKFLISAHLYILYSLQMKPTENLMETKNRVYRLVLTGGNHWIIFLSISRPIGIYYILFSFRGKSRGIVSHFIFRTTLSHSLSIKRFTGGKPPRVSILITHWSQMFLKNINRSKLWALCQGIL